MDNTQAFLETFERSRLRVEDIVIHLPESVGFLNSFKDNPELFPQEHLRAVPILISLLKLLLYSSRTCDTVCQRFARAGSAPSLATEQVGKALMCFALARLYRTTAKATQATDFARQFCRILVLSSIGAGEAEKVDWVIQAVNRSRHGSSQDWLAPALLFTIWTTNLESPSKARQVAGLLDELDSYVDRIMQRAIVNEVYMQFPW